MWSVLPGTTLSSASRTRLCQAGNRPCLATQLVQLAQPLLFGLWLKAQLVQPAALGAQQGLPAMAW